MTKTSIERLSLSELVAVHNILNPNRSVLHFRNKATGLKRVRDLIHRASLSSMAELRKKMPDLDLELEVGEANSIALDAPNDDLEAAMEDLRNAHATEIAESVVRGRERTTLRFHRQLESAIRQIERDQDRPEVAQKKNGRGRKSSFIGSRIVSTKTVNPRRPGSHGWRSMKIIIESGPDGISYEDFIAAGGRAVDLRWDVAHGNVMVVKS